MNLAPATVDIQSENTALTSPLSDKLVWCIFQTAARKTTLDIWGRVALFPHTLSESAAAVGLRWVEFFPYV